MCYWSGFVWIMARKSSSRKCPACVEAGVKKNGKTRKGVTRYRCTHCGASHCQTRPDITRKAQPDKFAQWIIGKLSISEVTSQSRMTWSRQNDWCWRVEPRIPVTGEVYDEIQVDGTYLPYEWCLLTAMSRGKVLAWQWCNRENKSAYRALFKRPPSLQPPGQAAQRRNPVHVPRSRPEQANHPTPHIQHKPAGRWDKRTNQGSYPAPQRPVRKSHAPSSGIVVLPAQREPAPAPRTRPIQAPKPPTKPEIKEPKPGPAE